MNHRSPDPPKLKVVKPIRGHNTPQKNDPKKIDIFYSNQSPHRGKDSSLSNPRHESNKTKLPILPPLAGGQNEKSRVMNKNFGRKKIILDPIDFNDKKEENLNIIEDYHPIYNYAPIYNPPKLDMTMLKMEVDESQSSSNKSNDFNKTKKSIIPESRSFDDFNSTQKSVIDDFFSDSSDYDFEMFDSDSDSMNDGKKRYVFKLDKEYKSVDELHTEVKKRVDSLIKIGRNHFPATKNNTAMLIRLVEQSRACHEFHFLEKRVKYYEAENRGLHLQVSDESPRQFGGQGARHRIKQLNHIQQRYAKRLMKELSRAERKLNRLKDEVSKLKEMNPTSNNRGALYEGDSKFTKLKQELNFSLAKEKESVDVLMKEVNDLQKEYESVEKRINLMTHKKSNISKTPNSNPNSPNNLQAKKKKEKNSDDDYIELYI